jgi:lipid-A-disaccharide synthase
MDKEVVTELIQKNCSPHNIKIELAKILNEDQRAIILENYNILETKLGGLGASKKVAQQVVNSLL